MKNLKLFKVYLFYLRILSFAIQWIRPANPLVSVFPASAAAAASATETTSYLSFVVFWRKKSPDFAFILALSLRPKLCVINAYKILQIHYFIILNKF